MRNPANDTQTLQLPRTTQDYVKNLMRLRGVTVQKLCDDTGLVKSTLDKWFAGQTADTSFSNVKTMVKYLGGSLDQLAQIEASAAPDPAPDPQEKNILADDPAMALLVESYKKEVESNSEQHQMEIDRFSNVHEKYLTHVLQLGEKSRQALIAQHNAAIQHTRDMCDAALAEKQRHLESFKKGRDVWRGVSLVLVILILVISVWMVWEFINLPLGLTGYLLRDAGILSMVEGGV